MARPPANDDLAESGRSAVDLLQWEDAWDAFSVADAVSSLDPEDLERWAISGYLLGRVIASVTTMTRAHHLYLDRGDSANAVRVGFWIVYMLVGRGEFAQAGGWEAACGRLAMDAPADSLERGYMSLYRAFRLTAMEHQFEEGAALATHVVELGRQHGDLDLTALALNVAGRGLIRSARAEDGLRCLDEAMVAVLSRRVSPVVAGTVYCAAIEACEEIVEVARAREWTQALTRWCDEQPGMATFAGQCLTHRSVILRNRGDWPGAVAEAQRACERFVGAADEPATGRAFYHIGEVHRLRGEIALAEEAYRKASEWGHEPQPGLALLRLSQGRNGAAAAAVKRLLNEKTDGVDRIPYLGAYVEIMLETGDEVAAEEGATELETAAATYRTSALQAEAERARGWVLVAAGEGAAALAHLRTSYAVWRALDAPYEAARTRVLISRACRLVGDIDSADLELESARSTFSELGAVSDLARLADTGAGVGYGLTARELDVLRLVATGMTNQAVADELFLAVRTVDRHVGNILTKLGVPSRTAATAWAYQHDLI